VLQQATCLDFIRFLNRPIYPVFEPPLAAKMAEERAGIKNTPVRRRFGAEGSARARFPPFPPISAPEIEGNEPHSDGKILRIGGLTPDEYPPDQSVSKPLTELGSSLLPKLAIGPKGAAFSSARERSPQFGHAVMQPPFASQPVDRSNRIFLNPTKLRFGN